MPSLPTGSVTFLFTDIEASTKQWEQVPEAMNPALARHDALMHQIITAHSGHVIKTMGDGFHAVFDNATDALAAVLEAQLALHAEAWPDPVHIRARMALHSGEAYLRDGDYFGTVVNRTARLMALGHGGQALISRATYELVRDRVPHGIELKDLGLQRLKDLQRPETVFQLLHPALPSEFPPLKSLDNPDMPNNLPRQLTSFIGREKEVAQVIALLDKTSLLTLTGSGGCGKTRLSLQVAADVLEQFPDGVWLVELASLADSSLVPQAIASVLSVREQPGRSIQQTLVESLKSRRLLIVLDNCEHLLAACAELTAALLRFCPTLKVLATSRETMGIAGEQVYRVPSLSLPDPKQPATPEMLSQYEAVRLFIERASQQKPDFAVTKQNARTLAQVCHRLDGIPLAIELAAARVRSLSVEDINTRLDTRFRLLTGGDRAALPRLQTLRAAIDWSYDILNEEERLLLSRLSVFAGGWTLEAAETVCTEDGVASRKDAADPATTSHSLFPDEVLDVLTSLVDKSLVIAEERDEEIRYRMLETVRQYATEKLQASGEVNTVRGRHRDWFLALAEEAEPQLTGPKQVEWLWRLEAEHDNLRAVLTWCGDEAEGAEAGLRLAGALWNFWDARGHLSEGRARLERTLTRGVVPVRTPGGAKALIGAGTLAWYQGDYAEAHARLQESLAIARELEDRQSIAISLGTLANVASAQGDYATGQALFEKSLAIRRELDDRRGIALVLHNIGSSAAAQRAFARARSALEEALVIEREVGDERGIAWSLCSLGWVASGEGDYAQARAVFKESLVMLKMLGDRFGATYTLEGLARVILAQRDVPKFVCLYGAIDVLRDSIGVPLDPSGREEHDQMIAQARSALGEDVFAAAWEEGRAMSWEQAVDYALGECLP